MLEADGHSGWMSRQLSEAGHEVLVANPRRLKLTHDRKSDRVDAEMLARVGRVDPKQLHPAQLRTESTQTALATVRSRDALIKARTQLVNHVRATVKTFGGRLPKCDADPIHNRVEHVPAQLRDGLQPMADLIEQLTKQICAFLHAHQSLAASVVNIWRKSIASAVGLRVTPYS